MSFKKILQFFFISSLSSLCGVIVESLVLVNGINFKDFFNYFLLLFPFVFFISIPINAFLLSGISILKKFLISYKCFIERYRSFILYCLTFIIIYIPLSIYYISLFFFTHFHNPAVVSLTFALFLIFNLLFSLFVISISFDLWKFLLKTSARKILNNKKFSIIFSIAIILISYIPPILRGTKAGGPFYFIGLVRKQGLPHLSMITLGIIVLSSIILYFIVKKFELINKKKILIILPIGFLLFVSVSTFYIFKNPPVQYIYNLDGPKSLTGYIIKYIKKFGDKDHDGYSTILGGTDCNDNNPRIHPGAVDIPSDNIDQDCLNGDRKASNKIIQTNIKKTVINTNKSQTSNFPLNPAIILITVDTLRSDRINAGYKRNITPNLTKLAKNGVFYSNVYSLGSYTAQSLAPMFAGRYVSELKRNDRHETVFFNENAPFLGKILTDSGFETGAVISHNLLKSYYGPSRGFKSVIFASGFPLTEYIDKQTVSPAVTDNAIEWLKNEQNIKGNFFLWVHYYDPHKEYIIHEGFDIFGDDIVSLYDHEVLFTDHYIGKLLDYIYTNKELESRVVTILTADHGESLGLHGFETHGGDLWEDMIRVPLIFYYKGINPVKIERRTSHINIAATILAAFGIQKPQHMKGYSLINESSGLESISEEKILIEQMENPYYKTMRAFIYEDWKFYHFLENDFCRLYYLKDDPLEYHELARENRNKFREMKKLYSNFVDNLDIQEVKIEN